MIIDIGHNLVLLLDHLRRRLVRLVLFFDLNLSIPRRITECRILVWLELGIAVRRGLARAGGRAVFVRIRRRSKGPYLV